MNTRKFSTNTNELHPRIPSRTKDDPGALNFQRLIFTVELSPGPIKEMIILICVVLKCISIKGKHF